MKRPSGGAIAAALAGLVVAAVGVWAQVQALDEGDPEAPGVLVAVTDQPEETETRRLVVLDSRAPEEVTILAQGPDLLAGIPTWSPDGKWLAWLQIDTSRLGDDSENDIPLEEVTADLVIWSRESGRRRTGTARLIGVNQLAWSPDSRLVAGIGEPFQLWDRNARLLAVGFSDNSNSTSGGGAWQPWSPDGQRVAYMQDGGLFLYDRRSGETALSRPSEIGLAPEQNGYLVAGWTGPDSVAMFVAAPSREGYEVDLATGDVAPLARTFEEFFEERLLAGPLSATAAAPGVPDRPRSFGKTADGRGEYVAVLETTGENAMQAHLTVEAEGQSAEFRFVAGDPPLHTLSVVLVGDWPEGSGR